MKLERQQQTKKNVTMLLAQSELVLILLVLNYMESK